MEKGILAPFWEGSGQLQSRKHCSNPSLPPHRIPLTSNIRIPVGRPQPLSALLKDILLALGEGMLLPLPHTLA